MRYVIVVFSLMIVGCSGRREKDSVTDVVSNNDIANGFVDAFYSFDNDSLESVLQDAKESQPNILYYQKWAECGHYQVLQRDRYFEKNDSVVVFPVTVKDDLMAALKIDFNVTDTFFISIREGRIRSVSNSSNDPAEYYKAKEWVKKNRPEYVEKPCEGIWNGGPTPCECVEGMVRGFKEFAVDMKKTSFAGWDSPQRRRDAEPR